MNDTGEWGSALMAQFHSAFLPEYGLLGSDTCRMDQRVDSSSSSCRSKIKSLEVNISIKHSRSSIYDVLWDLQFDHKLSNNTQGYVLPNGGCPFPKSGSCNWTWPRPLTKLLGWTNGEIVRIRVCVHGASQKLRLIGQSLLKYQSHSIRPFYGPSCW